MGDKLADLRRSTGFGQARFAEVLGVPQQSIAKWEKNQRPIPIHVVLQIAGSISWPDRGDWLKHTALKTAVIDSEKPGSIGVPILRDSAAAGTPRAVDGTEHDGMIWLPEDWLVGSGDCFGLRVFGDSMSPVIKDNDIVIVDMFPRPVQSLNGKMVLARLSDGVTIKMLQVEGERCILVPLNPSVDNPSYVMSEDSDAVIGRVIRWIGSAM